MGRVYIKYFVNEKIVNFVNEKIELEKKTSMFQVEKKVWGVCGIIKKIV